jgi:flagellar basal body-associated protein FliL
MSDAAKAAPKAGGKKKFILFAVVGLLSIGAGFLSPLLRSGQSHEEPKGDSPEDLKETFVPFCEATVNLNEARQSRYLKVKIVLTVVNKNKKSLTGRLEERNAVLKNWLIAYLSDKGLKDVSGRAAINRIRREILVQLNVLLYPGVEGPILDVLFEDFVVQ